MHVDCTVTGIVSGIQVRRSIIQRMSIKTSLPSSRNQMLVHMFIISPVKYIMVQCTSFNIISVAFLFCVGFFDQSQSQGLETTTSFTQAL